jgi:hypothetical protein
MRSTAELAGRFTAELAGRFTAELAGRFTAELAGRFTAVPIEFLQRGQGQAHQPGWPEHLASRTISTDRARSASACRSTSSTWATKVRSSSARVHR